MKRDVLGLVPTDGKSWRISAQLARLGLVAGCALAAACNKGPGENKTGGGPSQAQADSGSGGKAGSSPPHAPPIEAVTSLDLEYELELPRSTSGEALPLPWQEPTPTVAPAAAAPSTPAPPPAAQNVATPRPPRTWLRPAVIAGRRQILVGGKVVGQVSCRAEDPNACAPGALRGPTGKLTLDLAPESLDAERRHGALLQAVAGLRGQTVYLLADRRLAWSAVAVIESTLRAAGAEPVLVAASYAGGLVQLQPPTPAVPVPVAANLPAPASPSGGESSPAGGVPDDLSGVVVGVTAHGVSLLLERKGAEAQQPELMGNVLESLSAWAERLRAAAPAVDRVQVRIEPDAPYEEVVRAVDALRDTCARVAKGTPCHERRTLYPRIELIVASAVVAPAEAVTATDAAPVPVLEGEPGLRFEPPAGGLRLQGGLDDAIERPRFESLHLPKGENPGAQAKPAHHKQAPPMEKSGAMRPGQGAGGRPGGGTGQRPGGASGSGDRPAGAGTGAGDRP